MASSHAKSQRSEREVHDMISKLTDRLVSLGQGEHEHHNHSHHDADHGFRIITLAGENKGAAMKAENLDELEDTQGMVSNDESMMSAYTNSNYQAVNNSIMLDGSCTAEDPGVHIIITDNLDDDSSSSEDSDSDSDESDEEHKKGKKGKKKESKKKKDEKKKEGKKKEKKKEGTSKKEHDSESEGEEKGKEKGKVEK